MSYSANLKREILSVENNDKNLIMAELFGIFSTKDILKKNKIHLSTENIILAKRVYFNLKKITNIQIQLKYLKSNKLNLNKIYEVILMPKESEKKEYKNLLKEIKKYKNLKEIKDEEISAIVRGFFLNAGYIKTPEKGYALDFFIDTEESAQFLYNIFLKQNKKVFLTEKKDKKLVYLRNSEDILDIVFMIGAVNSFFKFEEVTINKEIRNKINRTMNWEIANEAKKFTTSERHINMIQEIDKKIGLSKLSDVLRETAEARLENDEASLQELADILNVSKSGIRNRFRRLEELYNSVIEKSKKE